MSDEIREKLGLIESFNCDGGSLRLVEKIQDFFETNPSNVGDMLL